MFKHAAPTITLTIANETVTLLPQRAVWWGRCKTLLISDLHLGKVETFASVGVPLPAMMHTQLATLSALISATQCERVLMLGDVLHAPAGLTPLMIDEVARWREQQGSSFAIVPGNHDRHIEKVANWWNMQVLPDVHHEGPFAFTHIPREIAGKFTWAGHVHPVVKLRSSSDTLKLWCFVMDEAARVAILPAFCDFTSGGRFERTPSTRVFAIAEGQVIEM